MAVVTAQDAAQAVQQWHRNNEQGRKLPPTLARIRTLMEKDTFSICNVGPWPYRLERGVVVVDLPAYDPKNDREKLGYAKSAPLPTLRREAKIIDENEFGYFEDDGFAVADDLIGVGFGMHPSNSLTQYGVFRPAGNEPTVQEISAAKQKLSDYYDELITEARDAYDLGPEMRKATIKDRHLLAARVRGIDEKWVHHQHTEESVRCEMCGKFNPAGVAKCACGTILDFDLYQKVQARQEAMMEAATAPKKK